MTSRVIAIDGPSGSGKSTTARAIAERLQLAHVDSGALYRAAALAALDAATTPLKEALGPDPDMWNGADNSRFR